MMNRREVIYCVEDDAGIRELIVYTLKATGFEAYGFEESKGFFEAIGNKLPELILLDVMLPNEDGITILKKLKSSAALKDIPVIMVTAKGAEYDKVLALDTGADDYITKPFGMMEMVSRIKAVLRRSGPKAESDELRVGDISVNISRHTVKAGGKEIALTLKEFELLRYMMENEGIVLSRDKLLQRIWGYDYDGETRTVDVHVRMLRQKLGESGNLIQTVRGVGYRIGGLE